MSLKGIDNAAYYRLVADDRRFYYDTTGTGNSLNVGHPHTLQLIMDSLRYWVTEMHAVSYTHLDVYKRQSSTSRTSMGLTEPIMRVSLLRRCWRCWNWR